MIQQAQSVRIYETNTRIVVKYSLKEDIALRREDILFNDAIIRIDENTGAIYITGNKVIRKSFFLPRHMDKEQFDLFCEKYKVSDEDYKIVRPSQGILSRLFGGKISKTDDYVVVDFTKKIFFPKEKIGKISTIVVTSPYILDEV